MNLPHIAKQKSTHRVAKSLIVQVYKTFVLPLYECLNHTDFNSLYSVV